MSLAARLHYYRRIFSAYLLPGKSQLSFWHETPEANDRASLDELGEYYMPFREKADYTGDHDDAGIPMLDYHGRIGRQYNPIAIAQWGLGNFNLYLRTQDEARKQKFLAAADWLVANLESNRFGVAVWNHHFDWEYRTPLKAPWYSGLAQGQGISLLVRAAKSVANPAYLEAARQAFAAFLHPVEEGGVNFVDKAGNLWFEEYLVSPPTHILNGFIWAAWGVRDFYLATSDAEARELFDKAVQTLRVNLPRYDLGFWSLYEQSGTRLPMTASPFYHRLHIVQLQMLHRMTGEQIFAHYAERWAAYTQSRIGRARALCYKSVFKLCYY